MSNSVEEKTSYLIGGGVVAGILASLCCVGPLVLTIIGVSGAAALAKFEVIRWPMTIIVIGIFAYAGKMLYGKRNNCEPGSVCSDPKKWRTLAYSYWLGLCLAIIGITSPYWVIWIFD